MAGLLDDGLPGASSPATSTSRRASTDAEEAVGTRKEITRAGGVAGQRGAVRRWASATPTARSIRTRSPSPRLTQERTGERIDYAYAAGPSETLDSELVGEPGGEDVDIEFGAWTSDHRAVLSDLRGRAGGDADHGRGRRAHCARSATRSPSPTTLPGSGGKEIAIVLGRRRSPDSALETLDAAARARARRAWTPPDGIRAPTRRCCSRAMTRSPASPSTCAIRRPELELTADESAYDGGEPIERRAGRTGPRQPLGLARRLRSLRRRPGEGRLPGLGLRRGPLGRHGPAADGRRGRPRSREARAAPGRCRPATTSSTTSLADEYESAGSVEFSGPLTARAPARSSAASRKRRRDTLPGAA